MKLTLAEPVTHSTVLCHSGPGRLQERLVCTCPRSEQQDCPGPERVLLQLSEECPGGPQALPQDQQGQYHLWRKLCDVQGQGDVDHSQILGWTEVKDSGGPGASSTHGMCLALWALDFKEKYFLYVCES